MELPYSANLNPSTALVLMSKKEDGPSNRLLGAELYPLTGNQYTVGHTIIQKELVPLFLSTHNHKH